MNSAFRLIADNARGWDRRSLKLDWLTGWECRRTAVRGHGFPSLQEMVSRELARRAEANTGGYAPERVIVNGGPDDGAKIAAMEAKYPGKAIVVRHIVDSPLRYSPVPAAEEDDSAPAPAARVDDEAVERAKARIASLRVAF
jgi:hypothetical protein